MKKAVGFSGGIGSGKSSLSGIVARSLGWPRASFGDYVRSVLTQRGLDVTRESCQTLGQELFERDSSGFCDAVLLNAGWSPGKPLVIDGIRHIRILDILGRMFEPDGMAFIFVETSRTAREERLRARDGLTKPLDVLERHATEVEVSRLRDRADLILDGESPIEQLSGEVIHLL